MASRTRLHVTHGTLEGDALLSSMVEGVMGVDTDQRIILLNRAGADLLGIQRAHVKGKHILRVIKNEELQRFVRHTLAHDDPVEGDLALRHGRSERFLQMHGTVLRGPNGQKHGALVVMNDVTRLKRLENVRRDFVANVSHELKTPITLIKGFVETLRDGKRHDPQDITRFLGIVAKHAERLNTIIEDLLSLARIEQDAERGELRVKASRVREVLRAAVKNCQAKAAARRIRIRMACPTTLTVDANPSLVEQAVTNLIDNAIKYSDDGGVVAIRAARTATEWSVSVSDRGAGIPPEHLPRLFERFYRVDKARSRALGGTGLGLAIVKHIAMAHGGTVSVDSIVGKGSTFTIHLPRARPPAPAPHA